jgi:hypothetical protein
VLKEAEAKSTQCEPEIELPWTVVLLNPDGTGMMIAAVFS